MITKKNIAIVIPIYNSEIGIQPLVQRLNDFSKSTDYTISVFFVDDGSVDTSFDLLKEIQVDFLFKIIRLERNYGQHAATAIGLSYCKSTFCVTLDDDLQHDPFEIPHLIDEMIRTNSDLVYGKFDSKKHNQLRNLGSILIKKVMYKDRIEYSDVTSFRLMNLSVAKQFSVQKPAVHFIDELLLSSSRKVSSVNVKHEASKLLKSRYSSFQLLRFALKIVLFNSSLPLKLLMKFGVLSSFLFFLIGIYFIYNRLINDVPIGFSAIIVSIFFISGIILMALGIIADYLRKIWEHQQGRSFVSINEICEGNNEV